MSTTTYRIIVDTADMDGAGTDANVYITLRGANGNSGERQLDNGRDNFERGNSDVFDLETLDLGELSSIRLRHDNTGARPGWFPKRVVIHNETTDQQWTFPIHRWFAVDEDDGSIDRNLDLS